MTTPSNLWLLGLFMLLNGCASLTGSHDEYVICPYDTVWSSALQTMKEYPLDQQDKEKGQIETAWIEMAGTGRTFGVFGRDGFGDKQRARMTMTLKRSQDVTVVSLTEYREQWHKKGGATQQATKWW